MAQKTVRGGQSGKNSSKFHRLVERVLAKTRLDRPLAAETSRSQQQGNQLLHI
ncbi:MAG: hypothetical protein WBA89_29790 [Microcoleus sp.]|uniref:hypothetical protein n=1 Tax=Microcoleus sp. TaxID=44472 RepID=UPI003C71C004